MSTELQKLRNRWWHQWLKRRIPQQKSHRLQHKNIFILPTKAGLGFVVLVVMIWLMGTNYQNNLVLGTAFLLLATVLVCIHFTYGNLSGVEVSVLKTHPGFLGEDGQVDLLIKRTGDRIYESLELSWPGGNRVEVSLIEESQMRVRLSVPLLYRGWYHPPRLKIVTSFPLGLIFAWSNLDLSAPILTYPKPISTSVKPERQLLDDSGDLLRQQQLVGHEEFAGLREYAAGDSLRNIDWKVLARGQGLVSRLYEDYVSQHFWLDWQQFQGMDKEARLSRLCACVLEHGDGDMEYGMRLPAQEIRPGSGKQHQATILEALALFEWEPPGG